MMWSGSKIPKSDHLAALRCKLADVPKSKNRKSYSYLTFSFLAFSISQNKAMKQKAERSNVHFTQRVPASHFLGPIYSFFFIFFSHSSYKFDYELW